MSVLLTSDTYINGVLTTAGTTISLGYIPEYNLVYEGSGTWVSIPNVVPNTINNARSQPYILAQSGVPVGLMPNGTVATNGQITLGTALPRTYSNGIWLYLPAGAVSGGAAGLYWCVMSSTTVGQVYTKFADTSQNFVPSIPTGTLVNAVGSNAAYTQTINVSIVLCKITIPAGSLGANGQLRINNEFSYNLATGTKLFQIYLNSYQLLQSNRATTGGHDSYTGRLKCLGSLLNSSFYILSENSTSSGTGQQITGQDLSVDASFTISPLIDTATNYIILDSFSLEVLPS
jgi:hypothetical protein